VSDPSAPTAERYKNFTVLVVDDQETVRDSVRLMLRSLGFGAITEAADGERAKEQFAARMPDLIICDINMTPTNGLAFVKWVRQRNAGSLRTPVLFLTAHTEREVVMKAKDLGVDGFLVKPVTTPDLAVRVDRAMRIYSR
jgi:two-component system, chemotaxis family, chemotaxis protein CheY